MLITVQRGEVYRADLQPSQGSEQDGIRPVVIVSRDAINQYSPVVVVVPCTDASHKTRTYPSHALLKAGTAGLTKDSLAVCEQVRAISKTRLKSLLGKLGRIELASIEAALKITMDLS